MPGHLSAIGFSVETQEDFVSLAEQAAQAARTVPLGAGQYLRWSGGNGEDLWLQLDAAGDLIGMNPHFSGQSSMRVGVMRRIHRPDETALDGAFHAWANPPDGAPDNGEYPFAFDCPDSATYPGLPLPCIATVQIAAFAHEVVMHDSPEAYDSSMGDQEPHFASKSFVPSGLFSPDDPSTERAGSVGSSATAADQVLDACTRACLHCIPAC